MSYLFMNFCIIEDPHKTYQKTKKILQPLSLSSKGEQSNIFSLQIKPKGFDYHILKWYWYIFCFLFPDIHFQPHPSLNRKKLSSPKNRFLPSPTNTIFDSLNARAFVTILLSSPRCEMGRKFFFIGERSPFLGIKEMMDFILEGVCFSVKSIWLASS